MSAQFEDQMPAEAFPEPNGAPRWLKALAAGGVAPIAASAAPPGLVEGGPSADAMRRRTLEGRD